MYHSAPVIDGDRGDPHAHFFHRRRTDTKVMLPTWTGCLDGRGLSASKSTRWHDSCSEFRCHETVDSKVVAQDLSTECVRSPFVVGRLQSRAGAADAGGPPSEGQRTTLHSA